MSDDVLPEVKGWLEKVTLWRVLRTLSYLGAIAVPIWAWAGSYVTTLADEAVVNILKKKGIDPQSFQGMQLQLQSLTQSLDDLKKEKKSDVEEIKKQQLEIIDLLKTR